MEYYIVNDIFQDFFAHIKSRMKPADRHKLCIIYQDTNESQDIYIATIDPDIKKIIEGYSGLKPCDPPFQLIKENPSSWVFRGNQSLLKE